MTVLASIAAAGLYIVGAGHFHWAVVRPLSATRDMLVR